MKEIKINEFQNFKQTLEVYKKCLKIFSSKDKFDKKTLDELTDPKYGLSFAIITAVNFSQTMECLYEKNILDEAKWDENYYKKELLEVSPLGEVFSALSDVKVKDILDDDHTFESFKERIHKIRNCLAHGRYHLILSENDADTDMNRCYIEFDDPEQNVEGRILFSQMRDFSKKIKGYLIDSNDAKYLIEKVVVKEKDYNKALSKYIKNIYKIINNKKSSLSSEESKKLKQYFSLVGKGCAIHELYEFMTFDRLSMKRSLLKDISMKNIARNTIKRNFFIRFSKILKCVLNGQYSQFEDNLNSFLATIYMGYEKDNEDTLDLAITEIGKELPDRLNPLFQMLLQTSNCITKGDFRKEERRILFLKRPILYVDTLMSMSEYMVGYIRECNLNYGRMIFKFSDIDMGNINILKEDPEEPSIIKTTPGDLILKKKKVKETERSLIINEIRDKIKSYSKPTGIIQNFLNMSKKIGINNTDSIYLKLVELRNFENSIRANKIENANCEEIIEKIGEYKVYFDKNENEFMKFPEKMRNQLVEHLSSLKQKFVEMNSINLQISEMEKNYEQVKDEGEYTDYSGLFGHIRNSIVHSNYSVDYTLAAKTGNYEDMEFHFKDYKKGDSNWLVFECKMKAKDLIQLLNSLQESITNQVNQSDKNKKFEDRLLHDAIVKLGITTDELSMHNITRTRKKTIGAKEE